VQVCDADNLDLLPSDTDSVEVSAYKKAWARLLSKVYEINPFVVGIVPRASPCGTTLFSPQCGSEIKVIAIILKPQEKKHITPSCKTGATAIHPYCVCYRDWSNSPLLSILGIATSD